MLCDQRAPLRETNQLQIKNALCASSNNNTQKDSSKLFYLIVELESNKFELTDSEHIINIPRVKINYKNVYTGKKIVFKKEGLVLNGLCVTVSTEKKFVETQFELMNNSKGNMKNSPSGVLNSFNKVNVISDRVSIKKENKKPVGQKIIGTNKGFANILKEANQDNCIEISRKDDLKPPVTGDTVQYKTQSVLTYDQQSQTDLKLYESVVPASAAQVSQQTSQISQLIHVNNSLLTEIKDLNKRNLEMHEMVEALTADLKLVSDTLAKVVTKVKIDDIESFVVPKKIKRNSQPDNDNGNDSNVVLNSIEILPNNESSVVETYSVSSLNGVLTEIKPFANYNNYSEYTPPIKKNKYKLNKSMHDLSTAITPPTFSLSDDSESEVIGSNGTRVAKSILKDINWGSYTSATRKLLVGIFDRQTLATHSLTGKPSPAFLDRDAKMQLNPYKIQDLVELITKTCSVPETSVRSVITSKCADENKMMRTNIKRRSSSSTSSLLL